MNDKQWWEIKGKRQETKAEIANAVKKSLDRLDDQTRPRNEAYKDQICLFTNRDWDGISPSTRTRPTEKDAIRRKRRISMNAIKAAANTLAARIASQRPRPNFLTSGGEWSLRQRAKKLEKFVEGVFYESKIYETAQRVFLDACIMGTGFLKIYPDELEAKIHCERVFPAEIVIDEQAALFDDPRTLFQIKQVPAEVLKANYSDSKKQIEQAGGSIVGINRDDGMLVETDLIDVVEAWHLPSGGDENDGRHVITIDGHTLLDEEWTRDTFPFVVFRFERPPLGWFGQGLVEDQRHMQDELNNLLARVQDAMNLFATAYVFYEEGSLDPKKWTNKPGAFIPIKTGRTPPSVQAPSSMNSQVFEHLWQLYSKIFELSGVSQLSATSKKPTGIESGVALRTLLDTESQRFALLGQQWEELFVSAARHVVAIAKQMYKSNTKRDFKVFYRAKDFVKSIKWSEVDLDESSYVLKVYPASLLPREPAGRLEQVQNLLQMGFIDRTQAMSLLDVPDLERHMGLSNAALDDIDMVIEGILLDDEYNGPDENQHLMLGIPRMQSAMLRARLHGAPQETLDKFVLWMDEAKKLMDAAQQEQMQMQMQQQAMAGPAAPPEAPQVSNG